MKKLLKEFIFFVKSPNLENKKSISTIQFIIFILLFLVISYFLSLLTYYFIKSSIINVKLNPLGLENGKINFFYIILFGCILEEFLFRALLKPDKFSFSLFLMAFFYTIFMLIGVNIFIGVVFLSIILMILFKTELKISPQIYRKYYKYILYASCLLFAYSHLGNFEINLNVIILSPLLLFPKFFIGIGLSFIRVKLNLIYSVLLHSLHNLIPLIVYYVTK